MTSKQKQRQSKNGEAEAAELHTFFQLALQKQRGREALRYKTKLQIPATTGKLLGMTIKGVLAATLARAAAKEVKARFFGQKSALRMTALN